MVMEHTLRAFDADIDGMRTAVTTMGGLVERQFVRAIDAIQYRDLRVVAQVLTDERIVNQLHIQVDLLCNQIIAKRQPIAVDLREVIAVIHTVNDLERIGDEAKKVALKARALESGSATLPVDDIARMGGLAADMLRMALDAFVRRDVAAAATLNERDDEIDALRDKVVRELMARMETHPAEVSAALDMIFVAQSIERVGDHAKNIAEYVVNVVEGVDVRHLDEAPTG